MEETEKNRCLNPDSLGDYFWNYVTKGNRTDSTVFQDTFYDVARQGEWSPEAIRGLGADTFAALFQVNPSVVMEPPVGYEKLHQIMQSVLSSPDVDALRKNTQMNEMISTMTWPTFFSELYRQVKELIPEPETPNPENGDGDGDGDDDDSQGESDGNGDGEDSETPVDTTALEQAVSNAVDKAEEELEAFQKAWGSETVDFQSMDGDERLQMADRLMNSNDTLNDIMELAGRWKKSLSKRKGKKSKLQNQSLGLKSETN